MPDEEETRPTRTAGPTREGDSLADVVEMLLDKGVVINADIAVTVGETELLGVHIRAALASFETAAEYGLQFPDGTDMRRVEEASGRSQMHSEGGSPVSVRSPGTSGISPAPGRGAEDDEGESEGGDGGTDADDGDEDDEDDEQTGDGESKGDGSEAESEPEPEATDGGTDADATDEERGGSGEETSREGNGETDS